MSLVTGTKLGRYEIRTQLGAGGMGEVYLAQDIKLDRKVALKILPADVASNRDRMDRFVREAKSAATLNHPNIAHIYEIGESDGTHYIAMEFIDGETLRHKIHKDKAPLPKLLKYLIQVAQGLSKAHAAGIVHRDLKPDNIMITRDDYAKVLDFGLAKLVEPQRGFGYNESGSSEIATAVMQQHSMPGTVMGTVGYMSPEQASGRINEIDHRSDIFSFGCILFEAATGKRAFEGKDALDSLHMIVHAPTPQLKDVNPFAPDDLQRVVRRCLAKEPEKRYQSIKEVLIEIDDLRQELKDSDEWDHSRSQPSPTAVTTSGASRIDEGFWVTVLPFKYRGSNVDLEELADGLSEEIVTGLSRFSYLRVIARSSTLRFTSENADVRFVGKELGARFVMEGSLRLAGSMLRLAVQLVDSSTGAHLWAETYNRQFHSEEIFALQDDLVPRIVSTVADINGVLPRSMSEAVCSRSPDALSPYEAVLRSFRYFARVTPEELTSARSCLEIAVEKAPTYADAWAMLALLCVQDYAQGFNLQSDSLTSGTMAARRAVEAAPSNHLAYFSLAQAHFFQKELQSFRNAAERAVALNPLDGNSLAFVGELLTYVGDSERGLALATRAKELNPNHPGWFWYADFFHAYRQGDYRNALDLILKTNLPGHWGMHSGIAASAGQLGERETATKAVRDLLKLKPDFRATIHDTLAKWFDPELSEHLIDGLRKAGLEIVGEEPGVHHSSTESRADEGFWIAVLPFKVVGPGTELETLALGMTEEIVTGFSRFSYLRVMALGSTTKHSQSGDLRQIGAELGARYVLEGSIRQAGSTLRLAVQLVDASNGAHLWAETFDRHFQPDQIFAMQDELIPRIVSTCADHFGVLARSISDAIRGKESSQLSPYEALMRGFGYHYRLNPQEHAEARRILEQTVKEVPNNADCWAMLSWVYSHEYGHSFNTQPGSLDRALAAARRAVDLAPTNHLAYQTLAVALFFRKERANCLSAAERALALNPLDASNEAIFLITFLDDWDRGCSLIKRAMDLNPYVPGWYRVILALNEYRKGNYREAVGETVKANAPGIWTDIVLSAAYAQLGEQAAARSALSNLIAEHSAESVLELITKWFDAELVEHLVVGLRKAGFEIAADKRATSSTGKSEATSATIESADEERLETGATPKPAAATSLESRQGDRETGGRGDGETGGWEDAGEPTRSGESVLGSDRTRDSFSSTIKTIAVLPFQNLSGDSEQEYFADGITEEILNALAQIPGLRVAGRSSAFSFKGRNEDLRAVGAKLGVGTILEGTLRRSGDRLRITAQLIDAGNGYQLWSERYDRVIEDVFAVQDEIANTIAGRLQLSLNASDEIQPPPTRHIGAYELYLKGRSLLYQRGLSISKAIDCFTQAVSLDPQYAQAWAGLADGYTTSGYSGFRPSIEVMPKALEAARRALDLDENLAEAHNALACATLLYDRNYELAEREFLHALELNPNYPQARAWYGLFYVDWVAGRPREARDELLRLLQIDPLSGYAHVIFSLSCSSNDWISEAVEHGRRGVELDPNSYLAQWTLSLALECDAQYQEARIVVERALAMSGRHCWALTTLASIYAAWGKRDDARAVYNELEARKTREYIQPGMLAISASAVGEMDQAVAYAQQALDEKDPLFIMIARSWSQYRKLRTDSRFLEIVSELGFPNWNSGAALL